MNNWESFTHTGMIRHVKDSVAYEEFLRDSLGYWITPDKVYFRKSDGSSDQGITLALSSVVSLKYSIKR